jgi:hypothetical protein
MRWDKIVVDWLEYFVEGVDPDIDEEISAE